MERGLSTSIWCLVLLIPGLLSGCWSEGEIGLAVGYRTGVLLACYLDLCCGILLQKVRIKQLILEYLHCASSI